MTTYSSIPAWIIPWTAELVGYSPSWGFKEPERTEQLTLSLSHTYSILPLQTLLHQNIKICLGEKKISPWASLMVQWLRILLATQETTVQPMVQEDLTCLGAVASTGTSTEGHHPRSCAVQQRGYYSQSARCNQRKPVSSSENLARPKINLKKNKWQEYFVQHREYNQYWKKKKKRYALGFFI